ncbi:MAG: hypothetical protein ABMA64_22355 [Myxococcota bacterium]
MTARAALAAAASLAGALAVAWLAPRPAAEAPTPPPSMAARARAPGPRTVAPDAVRAGQIAGQLAEARFRIARGAGCVDPGLEPVAAAFAAARTSPDAADWAALGEALDRVLAPLTPCDDPGVARVVTRLDRWRDEPPLR